jgi:hypothetical protein
MRLVLVCLGPSDWDACHATCRAWAALARKITWPRQLVVRGSGKFRQVRLLNASRASGPRASRLAVLHVPNFFARNSLPQRQRFLVVRDGELEVGPSPEYEQQTRALRQLADITRGLWCVTRLSVVNLHGDLSSVQYLVQLPNLEHVCVRRSNLFGTSMLKSQALRLLEVEQTLVRFDSKPGAQGKVHFYRWAGEWFTSDQVVRLSLQAYQADYHRSQNRVFPPELCVTWSPWDTLHLDGRWLAHDSFQRVQDLTLRGKDATVYSDLDHLASLRRLRLVRGILCVWRLPQQLETLGLHRVTVHEDMFKRERAGFCKASVVSVCRCTFDGSALRALAYRLNAIQDLTLTRTAAFLLVFPGTLKRLRFARPFPDLNPLVLEQLFALKQVTRFVLMGPRPEDFTCDTRLALLAVPELELWGVPKRDRHVWTELDGPKIVFK